MEGMVMEPDFWRGKRVLLTGHTCFKGSWLHKAFAATGDARRLMHETLGEFALHPVRA